VVFRVLAPLPPGALLPDDIPPLLDAALEAILSSQRAAPYWEQWAGRPLAGGDTSTSGGGGGGRAGLSHPPLSVCTGPVPTQSTPIWSHDQRTQFTHRLHLFERRAVINLTCAPGVVTTVSSGGGGGGDGDGGDASSVWTGDAPPPLLEPSPPPHYLAARCLGLASRHGPVMAVERVARELEPRVHSEARRAEAGGVLRTSTRPTWNILILLCASSVSMSIYPADDVLAMTLPGGASPHSRRAISTHVARWRRRGLVGRRRRG